MMMNTTLALDATRSGYKVTDQEINDSLAKLSQNNELSLENNLPCGVRARLRLPMRPSGAGA